MRVKLLPVPREYDVDVVFDIAGEIANDPTRVQPWDEVLENVIEAKQVEEIDFSDYVHIARLRWCLDDLGLGALTAEILRRMEKK